VPNIWRLKGLQKEQSALLDSQELLTKELFRQEFYEKLRLIRKGKYFNSEGLVFCIKKIICIKKYKFCIFVSIF